MAGQRRRASRVGARVALVTSVVGLVFGLGAAPAFADPGNGNSGDPPGNANGLANGNGDGSGNASSHATSGTGGTFGDPNSPQPIQHPESQNGANAHPGPYSSTRDGSPSLNGNGGGQAVGKPCAGCVGKADNKNPPGQFPDGSDHNAGYECDRNSGIGKTNPAHTGCAVSPPVPETPPVPVIPPAEVTPPVKVAGAAAEIVTAVALPSVSIPTVSIPTVSVPSVSVPTGALPVTGSGVLLELLLGLAALVVGGAMTVMGRRRLART
jgi:hypothetical protein